MEHLPFHYANLAVRGRLLDDVVGPQLDRALSMSPDLVSIVGGGNDLLRPSVDTNALMDTIEQAVIRARQNGSDVLLATPVDPQQAGLLKPLRGRHAIHAANLFTIAQRHGCYVLNLWGVPALRDWRFWADDRIHLTTEGHRRVALAALTALGHATDDDWATPLPPDDVGHPPPGAAGPCRVGAPAPGAVGAAPDARRVQWRPRRSPSAPTSPPCAPSTTRPEADPPPAAARYSRRYAGQSPSAHR